MKYAFTTLAVLAIWIGTVLLAVINAKLGIFLPLFSMGLTIILFIIGFRKKI